MDSSLSVIGLSQDRPPHRLRWIPNLEQFGAFECTRENGVKYGATATTNHEAASSNLAGQANRNNDESPFLKEVAIFYWGGSISSGHKRVSLIF